jgi:hypothetical protein
MSGPVVVNEDAGVVESFEGVSAEKVDNPGVFIHNDWTGHSGNTTSSTYQV